NRSPCFAAVFLPAGRVALGRGSFLGGGQALLLADTPFQPRFAVVTASVVTHESLPCGVMGFVPADGLLLFDERIEDAHLLPTGLVFLDKLLVPRRLLVLVVGLLVLEDEVEGHVEVLVVDRPTQLLRAGAGGEEGRPFVLGEVFLASVHQLFLPLRRVV